MIIYFPGYSAHRLNIYQKDNLWIFIVLRFVLKDFIQPEKFNTGSTLNATHLNLDYPFSLSFYTR